MKSVFYIVGPTAIGKSDVAADVAHELGAEIINADAFQIYRDLDLLTAKPGAAVLAKAPHHLIGAISLTEQMNAGKFRRMALSIIEQTQARGKHVVVVGGSGLYVKALTHGLDSNWKESEVDPKGVFVFRDRDKLYQQINARVKMMFKNGVVEEVRTVGVVSATAGKMIGLREIRQLLDGKMSISECSAAIQQMTRRYAKRQLTWFRHQTSFEPLNLSLLTHYEAVTWISRKARLA
ncbi:MAG: tRNA (adenosine(37)-N6)-dimethylallyltransferase, partial [Chthoniobacterales bacterium]